MYFRIVYRSEIYFNLGDGLEIGFKACTISAIDVLEVTLATKANKTMKKNGPGMIKTSVKGAGFVKLDDLAPLQGELKTLDRENYEKYRKSLIDFGVSFVTHIWKHRGKSHIIDGHQGRFTMRKMRDEEGWKIPPIPVAYVEAKNFEEAKRKVLVAASEYGKMNVKSLFEFAQSADIPYDDIVASFSLPSIDQGQFMSMFKDMPKIDNLPTPPDSQTPDMKHSSDGVKQVLLFFTTENHEEFMGLTNELSKKYGKENISDTLLEVVREASHRKIKKRDGLVEAVR